MKMTKEQLAKKIKSEVEWLIQEDCGCSTIKLDDRLAICIGWSDGYSEDDETVIHSKSEPSWCINIGIKVWTTDDLRTDFDYIGFAYYENDECWDDDHGISPNEDYNKLAQFYLDEYESLSTYEIEENGKIIGHNNLCACEYLVT